MSTRNQFSSLQVTCAFCYDGTYTGGVLRILRKIPRWVTVTSASIAAAGLLVFSTLSRDLTGWTLAISLCIAALFAALAIALPQLQQWQERQASQLNLLLKTTFESDQIPLYEETDKAIDELVAAEEGLCLESVRRSKNDSEVGRPNSGARIMAQAMRSNLGHFTGRPDERTPELYEQQVQQYLSTYRNYLERVLLFQYIKAGLGKLSLTAVNETDKTIEGVQVEVHLPGAVTAYDPSELREPTAPVRPRAFGLPSPYLSAVLSNITPSELLKISNARVHGPDIDNSSSAHVTFHVGTVRPRGTEFLDEIHLVIRQRHSIIGTWEATATNAEGRIKESLMIDVGDSKISTRELIAPGIKIEDKPE